MATLTEVRATLAALDNSTVAMDILKSVGGVDALSKLSEDKRMAVMKAANERIARGEIGASRPNPLRAQNADNDQRAREYWNGRREAQKSKAPIPDHSVDSEHNQRALEQFGSERGPLQEFVKGG